MPACRRLGEKQEGKEVNKRKQMERSKEAKKRKRERERDRDRDREREREGWREGVTMKQTQNKVGPRAISSRFCSGHRSDPNAQIP